MANVRHQKMRLWLLSPLFCVLACLSSAAPAAEPDIEFIKRLYERYAWEATDNVPKSATLFIDEPRAELLKYLTAPLADALLQDRQCAKRTRQICRLDFSPMWASQDPGAAELRFERCSTPSRVKVSFKHPGSGERIVIEYVLAQTERGPRVADVHYPGGGILSKILAVK
jgi:hypothetical protein